MPQRFTNVTPPPTETDAFPVEPRCTGPCLYEDFSQTPPPELFECRYRTLCDGNAERLSYPVRLAYDERIQVSLAEASSNIVSRSESHYYRGDYARLSLRKHFYELETDLPYKAWVAAIVADLERRGEPFAERLKEIEEWLFTMLPGVDREDPVSWRLLRKRTRERGDDLNLGEEAYGQLVEAIERRGVAVLGCHPIDERSRFARYLGFVDIRTASALSPIAMGLLVPPRNLRHDPDVYVITGEYGRLFGSAGFPSTVFTMHDTAVSGARCAQACAIMALAMLADRGAKVLGSYDITFLARQPVDLAPGGPECLLSQPGNSQVFQVTGLRIDEMRVVLQRPECGTNAHYFIREDSATVRRMASRLTEGHLLARYPVVLPVEASRWWRREEKAGHAVLIIGMRRAGGSFGVSGHRPIDRITELIIHDPGQGPFLKRPIAECFEATIELMDYFRGTKAGKAKDTKDETSVRLAKAPGVMQMLFVTEAKIRRAAADCIDVIEDQDWDAWERFIGVPDEDAGMLDEDYAASRDSDYRVSLVNRRDLLKTFAFPGLDGASFVRLDGSGNGESAESRRARYLSDRLNGLPEGWYWCVAGYFQGQLAILWLFRVDSALGDPCDRRILF